MNRRIAQHQDVTGSLVVFDPTGRDLPDCYRVGRVENVRWDDADDGNPDGSPRPILTVRDNGSGEVFGVARVAYVLDRHYDGITREQAEAVRLILLGDGEERSACVGRDDFIAMSVDREDAGNPCIRVRTDVRDAQGTHRQFVSVIAPDGAIWSNYEEH